MKFFASFDTLLDPRCAKVVEIKITSEIALFEMILRANTPVCAGLGAAIPGASRPFTKAFSFYTDVAYQAGRKVKRGNGLCDVHLTVLCKSFWPKGHFTL